MRAQFNLNDEDLHDLVNELSQKGLLTSIGQGSGERISLGRWPLEEGLNTDPLYFLSALDSVLHKYRNIARPLGLLTLNAIMSGLNWIYHRMVVSQLHPGHRDAFPWARGSHNAPEPGPVSELQTIVFRSNRGARNTA